MCPEYLRTAKTVNCYNYSYFVYLSLVKSYFYTVFATIFCCEIKLCIELVALQAAATATQHDPSAATRDVSCPQTPVISCVVNADSGR